MLYGYNDRSELTSAKWYAGNDPGVPTSPIANRQFEYTFDPIGNRLTHSDGTLEPRTYSHNSLNQLTQSEADGSFAYDPDGNMTTGQTNMWNYRYDAENRLVEAWQPGGTNGKRRILHTYDYLGRRVRSQTFTWKNGAWSTDLVLGIGANFDHLWVYDGWNPVVEIGREWMLEQPQTWWNSVTQEEEPCAPAPTSPQYRTKRTYNWGSDLSGGLSGMGGTGSAGGVGGLLGLAETSYGRDACSNGTTGAVTPITSVFWPLYDGLGNVMQIMDASTHGFSGSYAYYPFGGVLSLTGANHASCRFRFSTKYMPWVSDQYDYGYRWLFPRIGRWGSRDPIEESGGQNLYEFARNNPANWFDAHGQVAQECCCCVERLDLNQVKPLIAKGPSGQNGHSFTVTARLTYRPKSNSEMPFDSCTFEWFEWTTLVATGKQATLGQVTNQWQEWTTLWPDAPTFKEWKKFKKATCKDCDSSQVTLRAKDEPALSNSVGNAAKESYNRMSLMVAG